MEDGASPRVSVVDASLPLARHTAMIHAIATIRLHEGRADEFLRLFRELAVRVRAEPGCLEYTAAGDAPTTIPIQPPVRSNTVTVLEKWADVAALQAHLDSAHVAAFLDRTRGMTRVLEPV